MRMRGFAAVALAALLLVGCGSDKEDLNERAKASCDRNWKRQESLGSASPVLGGRAEFMAECIKQWIYSHTN